MTVGALIDFLNKESEKGVSHVHLDTRSREAIRAAVRANKVKKTPPKSTPKQAPSRPQPARRQPVQEPVSQVIAPESVEIKLPDGDKSIQLAYLKQLSNDWPPATSLQSLRKKAVFSVGTPDTDLMIIGEAPGFEEELKSEPFVGRAGQKLDQILKAMGLSRKKLYITNICKFRPSLPGQTTNNRKPTSEEMAACMPLVLREIEIIKPKCILALGATAAEGLTRTQNTPVGKLRGSWHEFQDIPLRVSYHPNYLLRNEENLHEKRKVWEDMLSVMEFLNMPISEKQKGYFK